MMTSWAATYEFRTATPWAVSISFFFQAEDGIRDWSVTGVQTCALPILSDRTQTIRASVADVQNTLLLTIALVVGVILLFLRKLWGTVIPAVSVPMSLIGTFTVMYVLGYSLDNLSLMALTIAVGFVVDDAIVMIENIV